MHAARPSQTAALVAFMRALANEGVTTVPDFHDPVARDVLPRAWRVLLALTSGRVSRLPAAALARLTAQVDIVPLRVATIDAAIASAVAEGARQLVVLGAGLDTRAWRIGALADVDVFEVDHPATQATKRRMVAGLRPVARAVHWVPVDFERGRLGDALTAAGHRPDALTAWVWEGVVMYLTDAALRATLADVAACSAPRSTLALHYHEPGPSRMHAPVARALLRVVSEPLVGLRTREAMRDEVERAGFSVVDDVGLEGQADRLGAVAPPRDVSAPSRVLVARRRGASGAV